MISRLTVPAVMLLVCSLPAAEASPVVHTAAGAASISWDDGSTAGDLTLVATSADLVAGAGIAVLEREDGSVRITLDCVGMSMGIEGGHGFYASGLGDDGIRYFLGISEDWYERGPFDGRAALATSQGGGECGAPLPRYPVVGDFVFA